MVAETRLIAHTVIGAARTVATIFVFFFKQELGSVDIGRIHLIYYCRGAKDVVDALPFTLIAVSAAHPILPSGILRHVAKAMVSDVLQHRTVGTVVEVTGYNNMGIGGMGLQRVYRLAQTIGYSLTERTAMTLTSVSAGRMKVGRMPSTGTTRRLWLLMSAKDVGL